MCMPGPQYGMPPGAHQMAMQHAMPGAAMQPMVPMVPPGGAGASSLSPLGQSQMLGQPMMAAPGQLLSGCALPRVSDGAKVDLGELLSAPVTTLVIFGTYPSDFNMIEYAQKVRHYWPQLKAKGVDSGLIVVNGSPDSCKRLAEILDLPADVELLSDEAGEAGRRFGVSTGWLPDSDLNPYLKLLGMATAG